MEEENIELRLYLLWVTEEKDNQKWKLRRKKMQLQENEERTDMEEYKNKRVKHGLNQANSFLDTIKGQLKQSERDCREKEKWWKLAQRKRRK